jgi:hypothetical protein
VRKLCCGCSLFLHSMAFGRLLRILSGSLLFLLIISILVTLNRQSLPPRTELKHMKEYAGRLVGLTSLVEPPPETTPYGALVIAGTDKSDLKWLRTMDQTTWRMYPYNVNDDPGNRHTKLRVPANKGHEAMVYLSFIIDNYEDLPWATVFIHGHREAWHQEDELDSLLNELNLQALAKAGYINLRCDWFPSCPAELRPVHHDAVVWGPGTYHKQCEVAIAGNWRQLFPDNSLPETFASQCCAQFAVTRQKILRRPKSDYERMRWWLVDTLLEDDVSGRVFEKLWAYIFTGESVQ